MTADATPVENILTLRINNEQHLFILELATMFRHLHQWFDQSFDDLGPLLLTWFTFYPSMGK